MGGTGATALMAAAGKGRMHELSMLLAAGANAKVGSRGGTAREWALRFGHTQAADLLQEHQQALQEADAAAGGAVALSHYQVFVESLCSAPHVCCHLSLWYLSVCLHLWRSRALTGIVHLD